MKNGIKLSAIMAVTLLVAGCSSGSSAEQSCKDYVKELGIYMEDVWEMDESAASSFADALLALADKAPEDIAIAMRDDAQNVGNQSETATACGPYFEK